MGKIFISHAEVDNVFANKLCSLLSEGAGIQRDEIFVSSLPGQGIPGGDNNIEAIEKSLTEAHLVIILYSRNYYYSRFALAELGACWISKKHIIPLLIPPVDWDKLGATLTNVHGRKIDSCNDIDELVDDIKKSLPGHEIRQGLWGPHSRSFVNAIIPLLSKQTEPQIVSFERFQKLTEEHSKISNELKKAHTEIDTLKQKKYSTAKMQKSR